MEKLGSYKIIRHLSDRPGESSLQAWDDRSARTVVLRQISQKLAGDKEALAQYAREQKRLALHDHHHSTRFFGIEEIDGEIYFAREYVEGRSLADLLAEEPVGRLEFYNLAIQIIQALKVAHEFGVTHGRLKPNNVIVSERGQVRLTETGLPLTDSDDFKLPFRSPELRDHAGASEAGDIFSAGVLFYQMLTGQDPWTDGQAENVDWLLNFESPAGRMIDRDNRLLIEKMISSDPKYRGSNALEILLSLKEMLAVVDAEYLTEATSRSKPVDRWSARSWMAISALSMLLVILWLVLTTVVRQ